jgi:hypothetical protein
LLSLSRNNKRGLKPILPSSLSAVTKLGMFMVKESTTSLLLRVQVQEDWVRAADVWVVLMLTYCLCGGCPPTMQNEMNNAEE